MEAVLALRAVLGSSPRICSRRGRRAWIALVQCDPATSKSRERRRSGRTSPAYALALLLAEQEASSGDLASVLEALDAAAALTGGLPPDERDERRELWSAALGSLSARR